MLFFFAHVLNFIRSMHAGLFWYLSKKLIADVQKNIVKSHLTGYKLILLTILWLCINFKVPDECNHWLTTHLPFIEGMSLYKGFLQHSMRKQPSFGLQNSGFGHVTRFDCYLCLCHKQNGRRPISTINKASAIFGI